MTITTPNLLKWLKGTSKDAQLEKYLIKNRIQLLVSKLILPTNKQEIAKP